MDTYKCKINLQIVHVILFQEKRSLINNIHSYTAQGGSLSARAKMPTKVFHVIMHFLLKQQSFWVMAKNHLDLVTNHNIATKWHLLGHKIFVLVQTSLAQLIPP